VNGSTTDKRRKFSCIQRKRRQRGRKHSPPAAKVPASFRPAVAFPYVAMQGTDPVRYDDQEALRQGTLFPGLDLPFHKELRSRFPQVDGPLLELMALDFAIDELGLYLTTHADDQQALELYWSYIRLGQEGRKRYQEKCGPLMQTDITPGSYQWLNDPWPWDGKGN
jgi:spore coat protein JB